MAIRAASRSTAPATAISSTAPARRALTDIDTRDIHHCINTAWLFGGVDMHALDRLQDRPARRVSPPSWNAAAPPAADCSSGPSSPGATTSRCSWGRGWPGYSAVDVEDLTEVEIRSHRLMAAHLAVYRDACAGVRGRVPDAVRAADRRAPRAAAGRAWRGDAGGLARRHRRGRTRSACRRRCRRSSRSCRCPMALWCRRTWTDCWSRGERVSCDATSHSFLREVPQCWMTGQAAGVAAALAVSAGVQPRAVPVGRLQTELVRQGALVRTEALAMA